MLAWGNEATRLPKRGEEGEPIQTWALEEPKTVKEMGILLSPMGFIWEVSTMCWITSTTGEGTGRDAAVDAALDTVVVVSSLTERSSVLETSDDIGDR